MSATAPTIPPRGAVVLPDVGRRVRAARLAARLSQVGLSTKAGVSLSTVALLERAGLGSRSTLERVAAALAHDVVDFLG